MVRAFVRIVYHVRDAVSNMFKGLARCRRFESYRVDFQFPKFFQNKKEFPRGECLSAIVRMGIFTFNGREERIKRLV